VRTADAVVLPDGSAYLVVHQLPSLAADQTYQLWAIVGDRKVSVGVLGREPSVAAFHVDANPALLAVTAEQAGGVTSTDKTPVIVGAVPVRSA
jgi:anti-sigma-K factor RskA